MSNEDNQEDEWDAAFTTDELECLPATLADLYDGAEEHEPVAVSTRSPTGYATPPLVTLAAVPASDPRLR